MIVRHAVQCGAWIVILFVTCLASPHDGLGQPISKTANGVTTQYLVDDLSLTGYPQVVAELVNGQAVRTYTYGLERISELQSVNNTPRASFYQYDGRGTVRMLTDSNGKVTDTYAYDAFGNLIAQTGTTPNAYLYRGERFDTDLGLYYLRARWYNPATGRFMTRDPYEGSIYDPASLHRYNYARANPVNYVDPSGRNALIEFSLNAVTKVAEAATMYWEGRQISCLYDAEASMLDLIAKSPSLTQEQLQLASAQLEPQLGKCGASITWQQMVRGTLLNLSIGYALEGIGMLLEDGAQGFRAGAFTNGASWLDGASNYTEGGTFLQCGESCVSATGQNLTQGAVTEQELLQQLGQPADPLALPQALNQLGNSGQWTGTYFNSAQDALDVANQGQFGAVLQAPGVAPHMVTISPITGSNMFLVTDTGVGATYQVDSGWIQQYVSAGVWRVGP